MILKTKLNYKYDRLVNEFVKFLCSELSISPREITIIGSDIPDGLGQCIDVNEDSYLILVKEEGRNIGQVFTTIAHEMIHVKQYMTQELGRLLDEQQHLPYMERWWEKEAHEKSVPLVEKFSKKITSNH
jgi:hypothetical protein